MSEQPKSTKIGYYTIATSEFQKAGLTEIRADFDTQIKECERQYKIELNAIMKPIIFTAHPKRTWAFMEFVWRFLPQDWRNN